MAARKRKAPQKKRGAKRSTPPVKKQAKKTASRSKSLSNARPRAPGRRSSQSARKIDEGGDLWKWLAGAVTMGGIGYGVVKHFEAQEHATVARVATAQAAEAWGHAQTAHNRSVKLAMEIAHEANRRIAQQHRVDAPPLHFDGCYAAATNGVEIRIDMGWLLSGIVDASKQEGSIWGRVIGALAHEWYHFLDTARGKRASYDEELAADAFAGKQLAQLGIPPPNFAELLRGFPQSSTHPAGELRAKTMLAAHAEAMAKLRAVI